MKKPLHVLLIEDSEDDARMVENELRRGGYDVNCQRVDTPSAMSTALDTSDWELIICDHRMPQFSSLAALKIYRDRALDIPFLVVSGSIGEEIAVSTMKAGAHDYIMKDNLARLMPAVERELAETKIRHERRQMEQSLQEANRKLERTLADLHQTQQRVIQQERLSALGQMASGVAHDFNNALSKMLGFTELLLTSPEKLNDHKKVREHLQIICTSAHDAANVVRRLRMFYRPRRETETFYPVDLAALIQEAIAMTEPKWKQQAQANGANIQLRTDFQTIPSIPGNEADLREVLTNVIFNAVDAMPKGGIIVLRARSEGESVVLECSDNGTGMAEEVRQRCLEPFFSTKGEGGTGLGLSIVYGIIHRHGGSIEIQSELGNGTTFRIRLPIHSTQEQEPARRKPITESRPLHVLVVEDEPLIREIESEYLACDGHIVETAANGSEGLEKFRAKRFDLVLSDRAMPKMNGDQLSAAIKKFSPDTHIILVTGFDDVLEGKSERPANVDQILSKPFTHEALRQAIAMAAA